MKHFFISIIMLLPYALHAQEVLDNKFAYTYMAIAIFEAKPCNYDGKDIDSLKKVTVEVEFKYKIVNETDTEVIIQFLNFDSNKYPNYSSLLNISNTNPNVYYKCSLHDFNNKSIRVYSKLSPEMVYGITTIPIKLRHYPSTFSSDFSLGPVIGAKFRVHRFLDNYINILYHFGVGN